MTDHVTYRLPLGPLGEVVDRLVARRELERMFALRQARTKTLMEAA